jgi:hypothetical protein
MRCAIVFHGFEMRKKTKGGMREKKSNAERKEKIVLGVISGHLMGAYL